MLIKLTDDEAQKIVGYPFIRFPVNLKWTDDEDTQNLLNLCRGKKTILELGTHWGYTTENIARNFPSSTIHTVDIIQGEMVEDVDNISELGKLEILPEEESGKMITQRNVFQHKMSTREFFEGLTMKFDLIFIDASHQYDAVMEDTQMALAHLNPGGTLVWHDVYNLDGRQDPKTQAEPDNPDVVNALTDLNLRVYKIGRSWIGFYQLSQ